MRWPHKQMLRQHIVEVASGSKAVFIERFELADGRCEDVSEFVVELQLFIEEQHAEEQFVDPAAHGIHLHIVQGAVGLALQTCQFFPVAHRPSVINHLLNVKADSVLVFFQSFGIAHVTRPHHPGQSIGQLCHPVLERGLCRNIDLRQPILVEQLHLDLGRAGNQVVFPDEGIVGLGSLLAIFERRLRLHDGCGSHTDQCEG